MILASNNSGKLIEFRQLLAPLVVDSVGGVNYPPENLGSYIAHAIQKARACFAATGLPSLGDDSGLEVNHLDRHPGVHSARFGGPDMTEWERVEFLLDEVGNAVDRRASFICVLAYYDGIREPRVVSGRCSGTIGFEQRGENGFGYDSVFHPMEDVRCRTFAEMTGPEKHVISHRARACYRLKCQLDG